MTNEHERPRSDAGHTPERRPPEERNGLKIIETVGEAESALRSEDFGIERASATVEHAAATAKISDAERHLIVEETETKLIAVAREMAAEQNRAQGSLRGTCSRWMKKFPIVKMAIISAVLHTPLTPIYRDVIDTLFPDRPDTVLRPQPYDVMFATSARAAERKDRIVQERVDGYKEDVRERIARGEPVSFGELYLDMERLNGVDPEKVERAKEKVAKTSTAFAERFGDDIDRGDLVQFVSQMYGDPSNYEWGQASVTEYFETGKRNCVAIAKAQLVVLEGIIEKMPPEARARYELGINKMKQHEVATLTDKTEDKTYLLEGAVESLEGEKEVVGTKTIDIQTLKKGIVAEKPITVAAKEGKVEKSPDLLVLTDQPVDDGIEVTGPLSGSEYVVQEAKRQGFEPEVVTVPNNINDAMEVELLTEGEEGKMLLNATIAALQEDYGRGDPHPQRMLELHTLKSPSPENIRAAEPSESILPSFYRIQAGNLEGWSAESVDALLDTNIVEICVTNQVHEANMIRTRSIPRALIEALQNRQLLQGPDKTWPRPLNFQVLTIDRGFGLEPNILNGIDSNQVYVLLRAAKDIPRVNLDIPVSPDNQIGEILTNAPQKEIRVTRSVFSPTNVVMMGESGKTFYLDAYGYLELIKDLPEALKYPNIRWDCHLGVSAVNELVDVLRTKLPSNDRRRLDAERVAREMAGNDAFKRNH